MTSRERFVAAMQGQEPDLVPVDPCLDSIVPSRLAGVRVDEFYKEAEVCFQSILATQERFGFDGIQLGCGSGQYPELFGGECIYPEDSYPIREEPIFSSKEELERAQVPDPYQVPAFRAQIEAVRLLAERLGDQVAIGGRCPGTFNVVRSLIGVDRLLRGLAADPGLVHRAAELACECLIAAGRAYLEAGAIYIHYPDAVSSPAFLSPRQYEEFAMPYHTRFFTAMKEAGALTVYHPCGGEYPIICQVRRIPGVDAYHFSELVDVGVARQIYGPEVVLWGNVDPHLTLLMGTPEEVDREVEGIIDKAGRLGNLVMCLGCSTPGNSPPRNLAALVESARRHGRYPLL
jgi:uroporphyrinogen decarboxylase